MTQKIILIPIAMVRPTHDFIYAPSRHRPIKEIDYSEFVNHYADHPRSIKVSFAPDGVSEPQPVTAYGFGLDAWRIVGEESL